MNISFETASFKNFENVPGLNIYDRATLFGDYLDYLDENGHLNYRLECITGAGPIVKLRLRDGSIREFIGLVSNDYLGLTQHPDVKVAAMAGITQYGTGSGASPAIGGHMTYHQQIEDKIAAFFKRESAIYYTTGYTSNSATLQCLLKKEDMAILDMAVHTSVLEGCQLTNYKRFIHNDMQDLERILIMTQEYRNRIVVIDGVYSQDGDLANIERILTLTRKYGAYLMIDDAHGVGVIGKTGRGLLEVHDLYNEVDIITGTFSKTFAHVGGYVIAKPELIRYLKFQSRQHLFSVTATPASMSILKAIDLIDKEPQWIARLWENVLYFREGLQSMGFDIGTTQSAIVPVKIGDRAKTLEVGRLLIEAGVYANPIMYPAVALNDSRIRMSLMATHTKAHLDFVLAAFAEIDSKLNLKKR